MRRATRSGGRGRSPLSGPARQHSRAAAALAAQAAAGPSDAASRRGCQPYARCSVDKRLQDPCCPTAPTRASRSLCQSRAGLSRAAAPSSTGLLEWLPCMQYQLKPTLNCGFSADGSLLATAITRHVGQRAETQSALAVALRSLALRITSASLTVGCVGTAGAPASSICNTGGGRPTDNDRRRTARSVCDRRSGCVVALKAS